MYFIRFESFVERMKTIETPLIFTEKRALDEELRTVKIFCYNRREVNAEIESFTQTIK